MSGGLIAEGSNDVYLVRRLWETTGVVPSLFFGRTYSGCRVGVGKKTVQYPNAERTLQAGLVRLSACPTASEKLEGLRGTAGDEAPAFWQRSACSTFFHQDLCNRLNTDFQALLYSKTLYPKRCELMFNLQV